MGRRPVEDCLENKIEDIIKGHSCLELITGLLIKLVKEEKAESYDKGYLDGKEQK